MPETENEKRDSLISDLLSESSVHMDGAFFFVWTDMHCSAENKRGWFPFWECADRIIVDGIRLNRRIPKES